MGEPMVEDERGTRVGQSKRYGHVRMVGAGLLTMGLGFMWVCWATIIQDLDGFANPEWIDWARQNLPPVGLFLPYYLKSVPCGVALVGHGIFLWSAFYHGTEDVVLLLRLGWGVCIGMGLTCSMYLMNFALYPPWPGPWDWQAVRLLVSMLLALPVLSVLVVVFKARDARAYVRRQAWFMSVFALIGVGLLVWNMCYWPSPMMSVGRSLGTFLFALTAFAMSLVMLGMSRRRYLSERAEHDGMPVCGKCGYDLSGTVAGGGRFCPECGWEAGKRRWETQQGDKQGP